MFEINHRRPEGQSIVVSLNLRIRWVKLWGFAIYKILLHTTSYLWYEGPLFWLIGLVGLVYSIEVWDGTLMVAGREMLLRGLTHSYCASGPRSFFDIVKWMD